MELMIFTARSLGLCLRFPISTWLCYFKKMHTGYQNVYICYIFVIFVRARARALTGESLK